MNLDLVLLYSQLPHLECQQKCQSSCGPIAMGQAEWDELAEATGARHLQVDAELTCPLLVNGRCSLYETRPMICRLWGLTESMACPFGCVPERWLTREEGFAFLAQVQALSQGAMVRIGV